MALSFKALYRFDEFELNPSERQFSRNGAPIWASPKALEILTCLVSHPGRVVTKDELLKAVWPDSFVEEGNLTQHISLLRKALGDKSGYIVTVPGLGYRFTARVQPEAPTVATPGLRSADILVHQVRERTRVVIEESSHAPPGIPETVDACSHPASLDTFLCQHVASSSRRREILAGVCTLAVIAIVMGHFTHKTVRNATVPAPVSLVALPFTNLTGDPAKEYLSDGITEEMINDLTRAEGGRLRVIARASSMSYKDTRKDLREISRELGVQYVLEGSVQSQGNHLHVTAELIRGKDQTYFWADTFDGDSDQILEFENHLTASVAHSLSLTLLAGRTPEHTALNPAAHDAYLRGLYYLSQRSRPGFHNALESFGTAVAQDPQYARAYAELAA